MSRNLRVAVVAAALSLTPMGRAVPAGAVDDSAAQGAFTCDFGIGSGALTQDLAAVIERDRIYMARRPGMVDKHLPLIVDANTLSVRSGGRYLFDTTRMRGITSTGSRMASCSTAPTSSSGPTSSILTAGPG